ERTIITRQYESNGELVHSEEISNQITKEAVKEIIAVGTGTTSQVPGDAPKHELPEAVVTSKDVTTVESLPYQTEQVETDELAQGQSQVKQAGVNGERTIVTRQYESNGELVHSEEISNQVTKEAVKEIIAVGNGTTSQVPTDAPKHELPEAVVTTEDVTSTESLPFATLEEASEDLAEGVREIARPGVAGQKTTVTRIYKVDGQEVDRQVVSSQETQAPVDQIVKVGTAKASQVPSEAPKHELPEAVVTSKDVTTVESIPYQTEQVETDELAQGQSQVKQAGVNGERTIVTRQYESNGELVHSEEISNQITKEAVKEIIAVGTGTTSQVPGEAPKHELPEAVVTTEDVTSTESLPFATVEEASEDLAEGVREIARPGVAGQKITVTRIYKVDGQEVDRQVVSSRETQAPVAQIVKVGTAKASQVPGDAPKHELPEAIVTSKDVTTVESIPYQTEQVETDELAQGQSQVKQAGVNGERTIVTRQYESNGELVHSEEISNQVTKEAVKEIIAVGTAKPNQVPGDAPSEPTKPSLDLLPLYQLLTEADATKDSVVYYNASEVQQKNYQEAVLAGQSLLEKSTVSPEDLNKVTQALRQSKAQLQGQATNKSALQTEYNLKDNTQSSSAYYNATSAQQRAYTSQLSATKQVLDNQKASQAQVNQVLQNLQAARASLQGQATNKSALQTEYNLKDSTQSSSAYYNATSAQQTAYTSQLSAVKQVLDNSQASQAQVDQALRSLQAARTGLQGQVTNKSALQTEYNLKDNTQSSSAYYNATSAQQRAYTSQLSATKQVLDNQKASQAQVNQALQNLQAARASLQGQATNKSALQTEYNLKDSTQSSSAYYNATS
ncbi:G5 domain-containing protein, partial [Streptococcus oricebi]